MNFADFITQASKPHFFSSASVYIFHGDTYPSLFFAQLLVNLRKQDQVQYLSLPDTELNQFAGQLGTAFLDQSLFYWLGDGSTLNAANKKAMSNLLANYTGPHRVAIFLNEPLKIAEKTGRADNRVKSSELTMTARPEHVEGNERFEGRKSEAVLQIPLPEKVDRATYEQLAKLLFLTSKQPPQLIRSIAQAPTLNTACLLLSYEQVLGTNTEAFAKSWLPHINEPESSLFVLSQHLLAKQHAEFMRNWEQIGPQYNEQFWIVYLSEQLWRAHFYIQYRNAGQHLDAKKISARLPFSFMQRDWKKVTAPELAAAHDFLYQLDHNIKNGASANGLNLFFNKFLSNGFAA